MPRSGRTEHADVILKTVAEQTRNGLGNSPAKHVVTTELRLNGASNEPFRDTPRFIEERQDGDAGVLLGHVGAQTGHVVGEPCQLVLACSGPSVEREGCE